MMRCGEIPACFDHDIKKPFCKSDKSGTHAKELRPITFLPEIFKVFEGWMHHLWISSFHSHEAPAGFKRGYSCVDRLFILKCLIDRVVYDVCK